MSLRIAYVIHMFPKISETFIAHELAELRRRGVELRVLSLRPPRETMRHDFIERAGLDRFVCYETDQFPAVVRAFKPDLLHAHFATEPTAAARDLAAMCNLPFTFTAHGYDIRRKPPDDFAARARAAQKVVTVSEANADFIAEKHGVAREHLRVIPCGVDTEWFRPAPGARNGHARVPIIVCVARHVAVKNLGLLLDACALLRSRGVRFHCVMVGDGPLRPELEGRRARLGLEAAVELTGALPYEQVLAWWQRADLAVLTSESEGMPVSLMEAAACGVPAVATAVGGVPELVAESVTGLLTPPGDAAALAAALQELVENPTRAAAMGRAARQRAEQRFSLARQVDALLALWSEVLRCPRS